MTVPKECAWIPHQTWMSDEKSKKKIDYQLRGRGWPACSYSWDESRGGLVFNEEYYRARGLPLPETAQDVEI